MASRLSLQTTLENILGSRNVYFQPPESVSIKYPAIVYTRYDLNIKFANNNQYMFKKAYQITVIDENPDSIIVDKVSELALCDFARHFVSDNLNHDVFIIYI